MKVTVRFEFFDDYSESAEMYIQMEMAKLFEEFGLEELVDEERAWDGEWYEYTFEGKHPYSDIEESARCLSGGITCPSQGGLIPLPKGKTGKWN